MDKDEISIIARKIGTFAASEKVKEYCKLSQGAVTTSPNNSILKKIPSFKKELNEALYNIDIYEGLIDFEEEKSPETSSFKKFKSVDIRPTFLIKAHPLKSDLQIPYEELLNNLDVFDKDNSYLFICDFGVKSEEIAFLLRKSNIKTAGFSINNYLKYFIKK